IVWSGVKQYGKPKNNDVAIKFLSELAGKWHKVYTGVCVQKGQCQQVFFCKSSVRFKQLTQSEIVNYVLTKSPLDKAGAYGIQDNEVVAKYRGSYTNIVGLPMEKLCKVIRQMEDK
ncbi:MAG: Maf family protein, partial [Clostridia bacterium]